MLRALAHHNCCGCPEHLVSPTPNPNPNPNLTLTLTLTLT